MNEFVIEMRHNGTGTDVRLYDRANGTTLAGKRLEPPGALPQVPANVLAKSPGEIETAGDGLYQWLAAALDPQLSQVLNVSESQRFYLDVVDDALYAVPWEILRWKKPALGGGVPTWVRQAHHLSRIYQPDWTTTAAWGGPIRVLVVVGCKDNDPDVEAEAEIREIRRGIQPVQRTVDLLVRGPANLSVRDKLYDEIIDYRPHVVHFIGHGEIAGLTISSDNPWTWKPGDLIDLGRPVLAGWRPRLVFLNACRSATEAPGLASMAGAFISNGTLATIAMRGNIKGQAAGALSAAFYAEVAAGNSPDEALTVARSRVAAAFAHKEAAYPVLTLARLPESVLPKIKRDADLGDYQTRRERCPFLSQKMRMFVDQIVPRRFLCNIAWPQAAGEAPATFVLIRGGSGYGKSMLSAWLLDLAMRVGHRVRYVAVSPGAGAALDAAGLLGRIWGTPEALPGSTSPLMCHLPLDAGEPLKLRQALDAGGDPAVFFERFRMALRQLAEAAPITIVLDEFARSLDTGNFRLLWTHLLDYLGTDDLAGVHIVVVLTDDEYDYYVTQSSLTSLTKREIKLDVLSPEDFVDAFSDYLAYRDGKPSPAADEMVSLARKYNAKWAPLSISTIESRIEKLEGAIS